jgi:GNAT superfamily N-acetyltransferase
MASEASSGVLIRHDLRPGDMGRVIALHGMLYAEEYGFDHGFEAYVAETVAEFGRLARPGLDRLWAAERAGQLVGSIAIVGREDGAAQLRWFLVHPDARGSGLGRRLLHEALTFCRAAGYRSVYLWTVTGLEAAARLYVAAGFRKTETKPPATLWGVDLAEERYDRDVESR